MVLWSLVLHFSTKHPFFFLLDICFFIMLIAAPIASDGWDAAVEPPMPVATGVDIIPPGTATGWQ